MSIEQAIDRTKFILEEGVNKNLEAILHEIDEEEEFDLETPSPKEFLVGNYLGREEILANLPCVTIEARNTPEGQSGKGYLIKAHSMFIHGWVINDNIERLHRLMMRYAEGIRRLLVDQEEWGNEWFNPTVNNTLYSDVFQAQHNLMQGCRVEANIGEVFAEQA